MLGRTLVKREPDTKILPRAVALDDLHRVLDYWKMMLDLAYCRRVMPWRRMHPFFRGSSISQLMSGVGKRSRAKIPSRLLSRSWATSKKNEEFKYLMTLFLRYLWLLSFCPIIYFIFARMSCLRSMKQLVKMLPFQF